MSSVFAELRGNKRKPAETEGSSKTRWWSRSWSRRYKTVRGHVGRSRERHWSLELGRGNPKHPAIYLRGADSRLVKAPGILHSDINLDNDLGAVASAKQLNQFGHDLGKLHRGTHGLELGRRPETCWHR